MDNLKIDVSKIQKAQSSKNYEALFENYKINLKKRAKKPPLALWYDGQFTNRVLTYGNISAIVGASKSKKTFLKTLLLSYYFGNKNSGNYKSNYKGGYVIDVDTEQEEYDAQTASFRIGELCDGFRENYVPLYIRELSIDDRFNLIKWIMEESPMRDNIDMLVIDGIADLIKERNDERQSVELSHKLMEWSSKTGAHIITVIHKRYGDSKPTGHIGTEILKKSETVIETEKIEDSSDIEVKYTYTRGGDIPSFIFTIEDGLPKVVNSATRETGNDIPY